MTKTRALNKFLTDDQILELLVKFETSRHKASKMLQEYMFNKWNLTILGAMAILKHVSDQWK